MTFSEFLKGQFFDFVDAYRLFFKKTIAVALTYTVFCFVVVTVLFEFSEFYKGNYGSQHSLLGYFFYRYSVGGIYSFVDLSKTILLFFIGLFTVSVIRLSSNEVADDEYPLTQFIKQIKIEDIFYLLGALMVAGAADYLLVQAETYLSTVLYSEKRIHQYIYSLVFHLRIYAPLILFSIAINARSYKTIFTLRRLLFLFVALWLFNEMAYDFYDFIRSVIFGLILLPVENPDRFFLFETILGIPVIAGYFLGFYSAFTFVFRPGENEPKPGSIPLVEEMV